jgi:hypothetical protein
MKLNFTKQAIAHAIEHKLRARPRTSSEKNVWYILDKRKILRVTYPHGNGPIPKGTVNSIINQLRLNKVQFKDFVDCPLSAQHFEDIIRAFGLV